MADPQVNFFSSTLVGGYSDSDTELTLATGSGANLPDPSVDGAFNLVIYNESEIFVTTTFDGGSTDTRQDLASTNPEIVRVTARSGDVITVTRAQEGTTASAKASENTYRVILASTKKVFDDINDAIDNVDLTTLTGVEELTFDSTGDEEFGLPAGTTAQRPSSPSAGYMRFNTDTKKLEIHTGGLWGIVSLENVLELQTAQLSVTANDAVFLPPLELEYLVIAGGGGGGQDIAGGGGAGGYRSSVSGESSGGGASAESALELDVSTNYTVTVGAGGGGGAAAGGAESGSSGSSSVFSTITSTGGGGGGGLGNNGLNGGSGGGGGGRGPSSGGNGTSSQGFSGGGNTGGSGGLKSAAGGGGAAEQGFDNDGGIGGDGGDGVSSSIIGSAVTRGGGGGGGRDSSGGPGGTGGAGGGGNGGSSGGEAGGSGTANTGGGGGGGANFNADGGNGGSGVVILRYPSAFTITIGAGLTGSETTVGANKVATITAGTGNVSWTTA